LGKDLDQLERHWDEFSLSLIGSLYPILVKEGMSDRELRNTLVSDSPDAFVKSGRCAVDPDQS